MNKYIYYNLHRSLYNRSITSTLMSLNLILMSHFCPLAHFNEDHSFIFSLFNVLACPLWLVQIRVLIFLSQCDIRDLVAALHHCIVCKIKKKVIITSANFDGVPSQKSPKPPLFDSQC